MLSLSCLYLCRKLNMSGWFNGIVPPIGGWVGYWPLAISSIVIKISSILVMSFWTSAISCCSTANLTPSALLSLSMIAPYSFLISFSMIFLTVLISSSLWSSLTICPISCALFGTTFWWIALLTLSNLYLKASSTELILWSYVLWGPITVQS